MKKKAALKVVSSNPSQPSAVDLGTRSITLHGKQYRLCFEFGAIARGEWAINRTGQPGQPKKVSVLAAFADRGTLLSTQALFACSLYQHHPEVTYEQACELLDMPHVLPVAAAMFEYWASQIPAETDAPKDAA